MIFESYYSFVLTDFFEGLHHGHYPRRCEVCKQYYLMQSARRQKYCTYGTAPELYHGEKISCRRYAIIQGKAERAKDNPLKAAYDRRCSAIRSEKSRGTISAAVEVHIGADTLVHSPLLRNDLGGQPLHVGIELVFPLIPLLLRQHRNKGLEDLRTRVRLGVDRVADAVDQATAWARF